jgi:methylthioribose-1-phosphate isomerase
MHTTDIVGSTTGLWTRDMKFRSNLQQTTINKILKTLQNRKLIKAVKSIAVRCARAILSCAFSVHIKSSSSARTQGRNRKVYMLYDLEPSVKVKGNAFYTPVHTRPPTHNTLSFSSAHITQRMYIHAPPRRETYVTACASIVIVWIPRTECSTVSL